MFDILQKSEPQNKLRTLKKRAQFLRAAKGKRVSSKSFSLQMIKSMNLQNFNDKENLQSGIGYTITKKTGNSPERNRIKRRFRAAVQKCALGFMPNHDYVLIGRRFSLSQPFSSLVIELEKSIIKIHAKNANKQNLN